MSSMGFRNLLLLVMGLFILAGCEYNHDDLKKWVKDVENKPRLPARKLPSVIPYKAFDYAAGNLHSPFMRVVPEVDSTLINLSACNPDDPQPDVDRRREPLEKVPVQTLSLVGSIFQSGEYVAIIRDANNGVHHRVKLGQHLGLNYGEVTSLNETTLTLSEIIPNGQGCWESHVINLVLGQSKN